MEARIAIKKIKFRIIFAFLELLLFVEFLRSVVLRI